MNYEEAKKHRQKLDEKNNAYSERLKTFDKFRNCMGIVPDHIRESREYKVIKSAYEQSFAELRKFNGWYVKTFKKEMTIDRRKNIQHYTN